MTIPWLGLSARVAHFLGMTLPAETDFEVGVEAWPRGKNETALKEFRSLANQGHAEAQLNLGVMYSQGLGVRKDYVQAYMWVALAAAQDEPEAAEFREMVAQDYDTRADR